MLVRVVYKNGKYDMVKPGLLNGLIYENKIERFQRSRQWAVIGRDNIRISKDRLYAGPERRLPLNS